MMLAKYTDLHGRGEPPLPNWDKPRHDEPAHGYFVRLVGLNQQPSASVVASSFGLNGRDLQPSECLDFAMSFPVENKERLLSATPTVNAATVTMFGETFRRRDWSIARRYFCPSCLAEDAYHRAYWDLVMFRHCPFHNQPLRCIDLSGHQVPWWWPSFEYSPFGKPIIEHRNRVDLLRPAAEAYVLGRLGLTQTLAVPLLDELPTLAGVLSAIEFAGKLVLGGFRETRPSLASLGKDSVTRAGFDLLQKGNDAIVQTLETLAADTSARGTRRDRGLEFLFGWAYRAAKESSVCGTLFTDRMVEVAALREGHTRSVRKLKDVKQRIKLTDVTDLSQEFGVTQERIRRIAGLLGIRKRQSDSFNHYVAFSVDEVRLIRQTLLEFIDRDGAAKLLDIPRPFFDGIVHIGLVPRFIRMNGAGSDMDRFRPEDIRSFADALIMKANTFDTVPSTGQLLNQIRRTSRTNPADLVQQIIEGKTPILGRCGETFGSIVVPAQVRRRVTRTYRRNDAASIGTIDAAAALGVAHAVVVMLRKLRYLKCYGPSAKLLDRHAFEVFCTRFSASHPYARILGCDPTRAGRQLAALGVKVIRLDQKKYSSYLVDRASARRALGLQSDPDELRTGSTQAFVAGLVERLRKSTTFRLSSQRDGITFRTGRGTLTLYVTINWEHGSLDIGPRYNLRITPGAALELFKRRSQIDAAFGGELAWIKDPNWLRIHTSLEKLPFEASARWADIYLQVVEVFAKFKTHFEPPHRRYKCSAKPEKVVDR
jgi:TniQ